MSASAHRRALCTLVAIATLAVELASVRAQQSEGDLERLHRVADLLTLLDARAGAVIADVGAGDGFFSVRIAHAVGPTGRVVAVDVSESALEKMRERIAKGNDDNVDVVLGATDDPHLTTGRFDAVLIHNAYHEMTEHEAMLYRVREALKVGGRLVIVEPMHDSSRGLPREKQVAAHDIDMDIVDQELRAAGFDVVQRDDMFVKFTGVGGGFWMILARRP